MKAILLAAGKSTRTYPLTLTRPKPLLKVCNKTLLEYNLDELCKVDSIDEVIIVVGYMKEMIQAFVGDSYEGSNGSSLKVSYVEQTEQLGTGHAMRICKDKIGDSEKFIVMNGDDLYSANDIISCLKHDNCILGKDIDNPSRFGIILMDDNSNVVDFYEKPKEQVGNIANTGLYVFSKNVFNIELEKSERGEYEIVNYVKQLAKSGKMKCEIVKDYWLTIGYPWDLLNVNEFMISKISESQIHGEVEIGVNIKGILHVGEGSRVLSGVYVEGTVIIGKNCKVGPNCYLRNGTVIGDNCHIGQAVELKNTIVMDNSNIPHLSYVGDSVIGAGVNLGAGTITANLKHDNSNVMSAVNSEVIDTGRRKLGVIVGDRVHTGINTSLYPGRKLWPGTTTLPGEIVSADKTE